MSGMVEGLAEFLLARYAEDEAVAREAVEPTPVPAHYRDAEPSWEAWAGLDLESGDYLGSVSMSPARVLADVEAKRRLVIELSRMERDEMGWDGIEAKVMGYLALPYADHPDYRQEWRP